MQDKYLKRNDTHKDSFFPVGSTGAVQREDGGPWMHEVTVEDNSIDPNQCSYQVRVTKTGRLITQHNPCQEFTDNDETVLQRADHERHWTSERLNHGHTQLS